MNTMGEDPAWIGQIVGDLDQQVSLQQQILNKHQMILYGIFGIGLGIAWLIYKGK